MRGKECVIAFVKIFDGITPAYAGKRGGGPCPDTWLQDHPRVCGEKDLQMFAQASAQGSPPRMRGKVHQLREAAQFGGITPAYAGKRWTRLPSRAAMRDHPRVCGEKTAEQFKAEYPQGSPPRMRGKA